MKKYIILIMALFLGGCYEDIKTVEGHYYIKTDKPAEITYITPDGEKTIFSDELNAYFDVDKKDYPDYFNYKIEIKSSEMQNIYLLIEFDNKVEYDFSFFLDYVIETPTFCPEWSNKCTRLNIGL